MVRPGQIGGFRARTPYVASARRFVDALAGYVATGAPLAPPGSARELPPWDQADAAALLELRAALDAVISTRRWYDAGRRPR